MSAAPAIRISGLGKRYRITRTERYQTLRDGLARAAGAPLRALRRLGSSGAPEDGASIWALKGVDLSVDRGEVLGVIGANGAGKTTLLKILSRITEPTEGEVRLWGRVGSLLEVGTGFHPELSGRENIFLNGAILGMSRAEIRRRFDEIVAFSGVETFLETPVKRYSSGMHMRLAFAVAAHFDSEILLIDEVLAVGDAAFQQRCLGKMGEVASGGRTLLFVSHNMAAVKALCTKAVWLQGGRIARHGPVDEVIGAYLAGTGALAGSNRVVLQRAQEALRRVRVTSVEAKAVGPEALGPQTSADAEFLIGYEAPEGHPVRRLHVAIGVTDGQGAPIFGCSMSRTAVRYFNDLPPRGVIACRVERLPLIPGTYRVDLELKDDQGVADQLMQAAAFTVVDAGGSGLMHLPPGKFGNVVVQQAWEWRASAHDAVSVAA